MTVQQMLEAHFQIVKQELEKQRKEMNMFQTQFQQQVLNSQRRGVAPWGVIPSF